MLVATDYFTKWTEAVPLKNMSHREVIEFITEHIFHRFSIPQTLTMDQVLHLFQKRCVHLPNYIRLSSSIHLHTMLRLMDRPSQEIKF